MFIDQLIKQISAPAKRNVLLRRYRETVTTCDSELLMQFDSGNELQNPAR